MRESLAGWMSDLANRKPKPVGKRTIHQYWHKVSQFLRWLDEQPEREVTASLMYAYRIARQREGRRPRTIRGDFTAIYDFFRYLERTGAATGLPRIGDVQLPRLDKALRQRFTGAEAMGLIEAAERMPAHTLRKRYLRGRALCIIGILIGAGLRRAELLALNISDIRTDMSPWRIHVRCGKGAQSGMVPIGPETQAIIAEWLETRELWCAVHRYTGEALFPVDSKRRLADLGLTTIWQEVIAMAGLSHRNLTPHCLRHWFGEVVARCGDVATAQALLRHSRMETTFQYLGTNEHRINSAVEGIWTEMRNSPPESRGQTESQQPEKSRDRRRTRRNGPGQDWRSRR